MAAQSYQREAGWGRRTKAGPSFVPAFTWKSGVADTHSSESFTLGRHPHGALPLSASPHDPSHPNSAPRPPNRRQTTPHFPLQTFFPFGSVVLSCFAVARVTSFRRNIKGHEKGGLDRGPKEIMKFVHIQAELKGLLAPISPQNLATRVGEPSPSLLVSIQKAAGAEAARGTPSMRPSSSFCGVGWIQALQL